MGFIYQSLGSVFHIDKMIITYFQKEIYFFNLEFIIILTSTNIVIWVVKLF